MWFRNLQVYRLSEKFESSPEALHEAMTAQAFKPCAGLDAVSLGWESPLGEESDQLTHAANGCIMLCARRQERLLPAAVVREQLDEKVAEIEAAEGREVFRKEKNRLKEEIVVDLLPRAFTRSQRIFSYIDPANGWILVDSPTAKKAEDVLSLLRQSLGSLKAKPLAVSVSPASVFTRWLSRGAPADVALSDECELREPVENGGIIRCRHQELMADEIANHLKAGKQVVRLAIEWGERIACVLGDDLSVKRLRFLDLLQDEVDNSADDRLARFDAEFAIMTLELGNFINRLVELYGGYAEEV